MTLTYECPHCQTEASVLPEHVGATVQCPTCQNDFLATPPVKEPDQSTAADKKARVPFFRSSRLKLLAKKLEELTADGDYSVEDARTLFYEAVRLNLSQEDLDNLRRGAVERALANVRQRIEAAQEMSPQDEQRLAELGTALGVEIQLDEGMRAMRQIYTIRRGELPTPISPAPFLIKPGEVVYYVARATWAQLRVQRDRSERLTELSSGTRFVTNQRLLFKGDTRSKSTGLGRIINADVSSTGIEVCTGANRSDHYLTNQGAAEVTAALIRQLRSAGLEMADDEDESEGASV